ncbi:MAG: hypothetical protein ACP5RW_05520 [bacterium]
MRVIILKDLEAKIESYGMLRFLVVAMSIFFLLFIIVAPGFQRVSSSFIPNLILVIGIGELFIFLIFTFLSTTGNPLVEEEKTIRDLALGSVFSSLSIVFGKYIAFILHLLLFLILTSPINLSSLNLSPRGDLKGIYLPLFVINGSLASWGFFISTMKDKRFAILILSISVISLLVFTARIPYPLRSINPIIFIVNYLPSALFFYLVIWVFGLALTFWRVRYLKRVKNDTRVS